MNLGLLLPELSLAFFALVVVVLDLVLGQKSKPILVSIIGIVISGGFALAMLGDSAQATFNNMLVADNFAVFFKLLFLGIAALVLLASVDYVARFTRVRAEYCALVLLSAMGMMLMAATTELITLYISLELASISLYILAGFLKDQKSTEASLKYLLLGAVSSAVLLYGMALIFGFTGETQLAEIAGVLGTMSAQDWLGNPALLVGIVMLIAGFSFKIAAVPFHMWVPDVYEGAPTPITAYLSVASKAAGFAIILRVFHSAFGLPDWLSSNWGVIFAVISAISMTIGNILAIPQTNIKRMFGYSSIAQAGYLMVGLATIGLAPSIDIVGRSAVLFFLASYAVTNLGAFIAIIAISNKINSDSISDFSGMSRRAPLLSVALTLCLISLIGLPPASGFIAKFFIFSTAVQHQLLWLVIIAVLNSVISAYYYLRVAKIMWLGEPASAEKVPSSGALRLALSLSCLGVLFLGIIPNVAMKLVEMASHMFAF